MSEVAVYLIVKAEEERELPGLESDQERFKVEYKEVCDLIRHYSTVRSALTTFLLTVGVASFSAYYQKGQSSPFFIVPGHLFLLVSVAVCLMFSYRTERTSMYQTELWKWSKGEKPYTNGKYPVGFKAYNPSPSTVMRRVFKDTMNVFLVLVIVGIFVSFWVFTAAGADHFARAVVVVLALFACASAVAIFWIVSASKQFWWATIATIGLVSLPIIVGYFLLGK